MEKQSLITKKFIDSFRSLVGTDLRICFRQPALLHKCQLLVCAGILALIPNGFAADTPPVPAFPGAEGFGSMTRGGRGGKVLTVTNLNDSGPGSLREACETEGSRIVVFRVSGTITLASRLRISKPYITIAGQTAPGDGICIKKYPLSINASEVIIRYIRVRLGDEAGVDADAISSRYNKNIIIDHVSASWSVDETVSIYHCENVTVQWCLVSESMYNAGHAKGTHGFGGIWGSNRSTYHHNLLAHHSSRNPRFASGCGYNDFRNNVVYNWGYNSAYGGEKQQQGNENFNFTVINMVANYYKPGPATRPGKVTYRIINPSSSNLADDFGKWYVADNVVHGNTAVTANNWDGGVQPQGGSSYIAGLKLHQPFASMPINQQTAEEAYYSVLESVGASLPKRDTVDVRIVDETRNGYATYEGVTYKNKNRVPDKSKKCGIIDSQTDVGGWPELKSLPAPLDSDGDGMPDEWEKRYGLDPRDASNASKDKDGDGYTNIEEYLNGIDPTEFVDYTKPENNVNTL
jgi:pectate lyase